MEVIILMKTKQDLKSCITLMVTEIMPNGITYGIVKHAVVSLFLNRLAI